MSNLRNSNTARPPQLSGLEPLECRLLLTFYSIMDLGTLGGSSSYAYDINNSNQVVGYAKLATGVDRAFLFRDANNNGLADTGEMANLGSLAGYASSYAYAISNNGVIVGTAVNSLNGRKAVRFQTTGNPTDLQMGISSSAYDVNIHGEIVGATQLGINYLAAYRSPTGQVTQLGSLGGGFPYSEAYGINDNGTIVGYSSTDAGDSAFVYSTAGGMSAIGFENQPLFYEYDYAWGINNSGQIVGEGFNSQQEYHAFRYDNGSITDLGVPDGFTTSQAMAINSNGLIVGHGKNSAGDGRAFIHSDGITTDLNSLIATNSGWTLIKARSINDNGYIVGEGISPTGQTRAFLLAPATNVLTINGDQNQPDQEDTIILRRSSTDPSRVEVLLNSATPTSSFIAANYVHVFVNGGGGNDRITLDFAAGTPFPTGGISVDGQGGGADSLEIFGSSAGENLAIGSSVISIGSAGVNFSNLEAIHAEGRAGNDAVAIDASLPFMPSFSGGIGDDSLTLSAGNYTLTSDALAASVEHLSLQGSATMNLETSQHLASLTLDGAARLNLLAHGSRFLRLGEISVGSDATIDLVDNDLIIDAASPDAVLAAVSDLIRRARNAQTLWGGTGLTSSAAAARPITGLAAIVNNNGSGGMIRSSLSGEGLSTNTVLVVYTYNGDFDVDGQIDADDYARIGTGYIQGLTGYAWGDIDYSGGSPDADDFFYIDRAHADQGEPLVGADGVLAAAPAALAIWEDSPRTGRPSDSLFWVASNRSRRRLSRSGVSK